MKLITKCKYNKNQIIVESVIEDPNNDIEILSRRRINLQDEYFRKALIDLGWTPPKDLDEGFGGH